MVSIAVRHKVKDFDAWLKVYKHYDEVRVKHGQRNHTVYPCLHDGGDVLIVTEWASTEGFDAFVKEVDLPRVMKENGVVSAAEITVFADPVA